MNATKNLLGTAALCCTLFLAAPAFGQISEKSTEESDFQARTGFSFDKKAVEGLHFTWSEELRLKNSLADIDRIYSVLAVSYKFCPWFKAAADYTFIAVKQGKGWEFRNRSNIDLTFSHEIAPRWKISLRERFRVTSTNKDTDALTESNPQWIMRSRLMAEYDAGPLPIEPYLYFELSNTLNSPKLTGNFIDKIRVSAGVKYMLSPRSTFDFFYRYDRNTSKRVEAVGERGAQWLVTTRKENNHILGVFYEYSF